MTNKTRRTALFAGLFVTACALAFCFLLARDAQQSLVEHSSSMEKFPALRDADCAAPPAQALDGALERERAAHARWERAPFALEDGPAAAVLLGEALDCFARAGNREGRQRAERSLSLFQRELERRYVRERLGLVLALRHDDYAAIARHGRRLLALISQSDASAAEQRASLERHIRKADAYLVELSRKDG